MKSPRVTKNLLAATKEAVKEALDEAELSGGPEARFQKILTLLEKNEASTEDMVSTYVLAISALVHHVRHGGLSDSQIRGFFDSAQSMLRLLDIKPMTSQLSYLHGELYLIMSQIDRMNGKHWRAAWDEQMSLFMRAKSVELEGFQYLSRGLRAFRLAYGQTAIAQLRKALTKDLAKSDRHRCRLELVRILRLTRRFEEAATELTNLETEIAADDVGFKTEASWEALLLDAFTDPALNVRPLIAAVRSNRPHYQGSYIIDTFLYAYAHKNRAYGEGLPKIRYLARKLSSSFAPLGDLVDYCCILEECYEDYPIHRRVEQLGKGLDMVPSFVTVERELLALAAAARWLINSQRFSMAVLVIQRYRAISVVLTEGHHRDPFGFFTDIEDKTWFADEST